MKCPLDGIDLVIAERHGIEIDYCPKCRGVWLDRGELDKIIERSLDYYMPPAAPYPPEPAYPPPHHPPPGYEPPRDEYRRRDDDDRDRRAYRKKRRGSFLEDLFDFD